MPFQLPVQTLIRKEKERNWLEFVQGGESTLRDVGTATDIEDKECVAEHEESVDGPVVNVRAASNTQVLEVAQVDCASTCNNQNNNWSCRREILHLVHFETRFLNQKTNKVSIGF